MRLLCARPHVVECRLEPVGDLAAFALVLASKIGIPLSGPPEDGDRALYLTGWSFGPTARLALGVFIHCLARGFAEGEAEMAAAGFRVRRP